MMKHTVLSAAVAIGLASIFQQAYADPAGASAAQTTAEQPWATAQSILDATKADLQTGGLLAVGAHVADLEHALADAKQPAASSGADTVYVLTDGPTETLLALAAAASDKNAPAGRKVVALNNPYPAISLYLGSYYNEIGKPEEALRVLDAGLTLENSTLGLHQPLLISERGAALASMKRWPDALADYDKGLALAGLADSARARLYRGRGFALTELGRLDEAEQAYRDSLKLAPGNAIAQQELDYIAHLRAGGAAEPTGITMPQPAPKSQ